MQIEAHACTAKSGLHKEEEEEGLKYSVLGEERDDIGERACDVVCDDTHIFTAERAAEGIQEGCVTVYEFS